MTFFVTTNYLHYFLLNKIYR